MRKLAEIALSLTAALGLTTGCPKTHDHGDTTPPAVEWVNKPADTYENSGYAIPTATATDNSCQLASVRFFYRQEGASDWTIRDMVQMPSPPKNTYSVDCNDIPSGTYETFVEAKDPTGNTSVTETVKVDLWAKKSTAMPIIKNTLDSLAITANYGPDYTFMLPDGNVDVNFAVLSNPSFGYSALDYAGESGDDPAAKTPYLNAWSIPHCIINPCTKQELADKVHAIDVNYWTQGRY